MSNYLFLSVTKYKNNCYEKCPYYYFFNENNNYICTENCYGNYNKSIIGKKKCNDRCDNDDIYKFEYNNICYEDCPNGTIYNEIESKCLDEKNIPITFIFGESTNIYNSILNTLIYSNINNGSDFSSSINEINISTKGIFSYIFSEKIGSTFLDNTILYSELKSFLNNILEKSNIPQKNETQLISLTNFQSQLNEEISQLNKTDFIVTINNEEIYQQINKNILKNYNGSKGDEIILQGGDNCVFQITNSGNELALFKGKGNNFYNVGELIQYLN